MIARTATALAGTALLGASRFAKAAEVPDDFKVKNGRIRQSIMGWCFKPMPAEELARHCKDIGLVAMEGISSKSYPYVKELGLNISLVSSHGFRKGPVSPENREYCIKTLRDRIDLAKSVDCPSVITFTGMSDPKVSHQQGAKNCVEVWKEVMPYAEKHGINLCLEHLNSRDDTHPMKGHPGYFGDDVDFCVDLIKRVDSPNMKLLFDIYHVQIMNGDVISRIRQYKDLIGHYHTAGCPGRAELDETQEINYPPIMKEIVKTGYKGYVAQEFIPTWDDPVKALRHAAMVCDV
ncbi:MAG: hydroxypyruvate isomerase [Limisphaerales bacterium]|jgi:hydroxypyruvate isomerase